MAVILPKNCVTMKSVLLLLVMLLSVNAAPFLNQPLRQQPLMEPQMMLVPIDPVTFNHQQMDQMMMGQPMISQSMNQIMEQQLMDQMMQQNQYNVLQEQLIALQQIQVQQMNTIRGPMLLRQPIIMLLPNTMTKSNLNDYNQANFKLTNEDTESVVTDAENEQNNPETAFPRQAVIVLPNGQRFFIGSIISAIPFLPFEVNVPDTIAWIYNGISGIIGGIGQRLTFRPRPSTTESPDSMQTQESTVPAQESRFKLLQKLMMRKSNVDMPIIMLPAVQAVPITVPIQV